MKHFAYIYESHRLDADTSLPAWRDLSDEGRVMWQRAIEEVSEAIVHKVPALPNGRVMRTDAQSGK